MPSTVFHWKESTQPTSLPPQPRSHWTESTPTSMMPGSKDKKPGLDLNWKTPQKPDWKESNKASKLNPNGKLMPKLPKKPLMLNFWKTSRKLINWEDIWEPDLLFTIAADLTTLNSDDCLQLFKSYFHEFFLISIIFLHYFNVDN